MTQRASLLTRIRSGGWLPLIAAYLVTVAVFLAFRLYLAALLLFLWGTIHLWGRTR